MIYALQSIAGGPIKLGTTENLKVRIAQLESHYGQPLAVLATFPSGPAQERELHRRFAHLRLGRTEQFQPATDLMAFLGRPLLVAANPATVEAMGPFDRTTIINLKGSLLYDQCMKYIRIKAHLSKAVIVRPALRQWAESNGHESPPDIRGLICFVRYPAGFIKIGRCP